MSDLPGMSTFEFSLDAYLSDLEPLINVDCGTCTPEGVATIADRMTAHYESIGWHVTRHHVDDRAGPCLSVTNKPEATEYDVLLVGHMDTVFPKGTAAERPMSVRDGQAYGPGVADMKSGLLNAFYALKHLPQAVTDKLAICVAMNCDEEIGSIYSQDFIESMAKKSKQVLVCEAARTDGSLVKARKGLAVYDIEFHGRAAHAGNEPEKGISAITEMAQWIVELNKLTNFETGTTLNFGVVSGGSAGNVVPEYAKACLDIRFWNNADYEQIDFRLHEMAENPFLKGIRIEKVRTAHKPAMVPSEQTEALMALVEACGREENIDITWQAVGGGSDANFTAALGIPSLDGLGPIGGAMHSDKEFLVLDSIEPRIRLLQRVLTRLAD